MHTNMTNYVFTDGCCLGNQGSRRFRKAGAGVFFGDNDDYNISAHVGMTILRKFDLEYPTNQVAELMAVLFALDAILSMNRHAKKYVICTDSMYVLNSCSKWISTWKKNGWKTATQHAVKNMLIIKDIDELLQLCDKYGVNISFKHVKAHQEPQHHDNYFEWYGNNCADHLAKQGALQKHET